MSIIQNQQTALANLAVTASGLERKFDYAPDNAALPCVFVPLPSWQPHQAMRQGLIRLEYDIYVLVAQQVDRAANLKLASLMDPFGDSSLSTALESDREQGVGCLFLDGSPLASDLHVVEVRPTGQEDLGGFSGLGAVWNLEVFASGV